MVTGNKLRKRNLGRDLHMCRSGGGGLVASFQVVLLDFELQIVSTMVNAELLLLNVLYPRSQEDADISSIRIVKKSTIVKRSFLRPHGDSESHTLKCT